MANRTYYSGERRDFDMEQLEEVAFLSSCFIIGVSGDGLNAFGHALLQAGGWVFHADDPGWTFPKWMTVQRFYSDYLPGSGKKLWWKVRIKDIEKPHTAWKRLRHAMSKPYHWMVHHNCLTFAREIVKAGGSKFRLVGGDVPSDGKLHGLPVETY